MRWITAVVMATSLACSGTIDGTAPDAPTVPMPPAAPGEAPPVDACAQPARAGRVTAHRLNRDEYGRTVRDLFGLTTNPAAGLAADPLASSFDNNAELLSVSALLGEQLVTAAQVSAAAALQVPTTRAALLSCDVARMGAPACLTQTLGTWGRRIFRRPLSTFELQDVVRVATDALSQAEPYEVALQQGLTVLLASPQFLFRAVRPPSSNPAEHPLDGFEFATRLSYLVWGSTPDDALLDAAAQGLLDTPQGRRAQLERLLADPRADALYERFARQWLSLDKLTDASLDATLFPTFDDAMRASMLTQTRLTVLDVTRANKSPLEWVRGTDLFVDARLASLYGVTGVSGATFQKVTAPRNERAGLQGHAAVLAMTSEGTHTNLIRRGLWLTDSLLCATPPPPPPNVPALEAPVANETPRQQLARHRADPACSGCHQLIDPPGFGLEVYDPLGRHRAGPTVDAAGALPDGRPFTGGVELAALLGAEPAFHACLSRKLSAYALGRELGPLDACTVQQLGEVVGRGAGMTDVLAVLIESAPFTRQGATP